MAVGRVTLKPSSKAPALLRSQAATSGESSATTPLSEPARRPQRPNADVYQYTEEEQKENVALADHILKINDQVSEALINLTRS